MIFGGKVLSFEMKSSLLQGNGANDRENIEILAYLPAELLAQDPELRRRYPVVYALAPWTSQASSFFCKQPFKKTLPERVDELVRHKKTKPFILVCPDYCTKFGGSQFVDSSFFGPQAKSIVEELFPFCEKNLPILPDWKCRTVIGRSSGGFGALRLALDYPRSVGAVAAHSADSAFDLLFKSDLTTLCDKTRSFSNNVELYLKKIRSLDKVLPGDVHAMMLLGTAGFYSPNPDSALGYDLPIDLYSGEIIENVWNQWLEHDPVQVIRKKGNNLRLLSHLYIECGLSDQFRLLYGARQMHLALQQIGIAHDYEEFSDNHSGTDYRFDVSIPKLISSLTFEET